MPETRKPTFVSQRIALVRGAALAFFAYASGVLALEPDLVASGLDAPLFVGAPDGDSRLFIVEKAGAIKVRQADGSISTFLNIGTTGANLINTGGERGLLGLAFDPNFATPGSAGFGSFYVNYIDATTLSTVVARYQVSDSNPNVANPNSRQTIITVAQPANQNNHKAGWIGFRPGEPDHLYIATGDGGGGGDPGNRAQSLSDNLGKMLRINVRGDDFAADSNRNYSIPSTNPFVGKDGNDEIWAYGLRNPFRNSFDRQTGDLWIADVGEGAREEVNFEAASSTGGANYGWRLREGTIQTPGAVGGAKPADNVDPVLDYDRDFGRSIIGGYVYRGEMLPDLQGAYIFGDFGSNRIWAVRYTGSFMDIENATELTDLLNPNGTLIGGLAAFGEDGRGELYMVDLYAGNIYALVPEPGTWGLLGAGIGLLGWRLRRRGA